MINSNCRKKILHEGTDKLIARGFNLKIFVANAKIIEPEE